MARTGTANGNLGMWDLGDNPGAGSKSVDNDALNGNWQKLDALFVTHDSAGAHKAAVIENTMLNSNVVDNASLELSTNLRIKALGVQNTMLNSNVVDDSTLEHNSGTLRVKDDGITPAKQSHDNMARKNLLTFQQTSVTNGVWATVHGQILTSGGLDGYPMPYAGSITEIRTVDAVGAQTSEAWAYGTYTFAAGDTIGLQQGISQNKIMKNGSALITHANANSAPQIVTVEVEFDD